MTRLFIHSLAALLFAASVLAAPVQLVPEKPVSVKQLSPGTFLVDFGKVSFGNLKLTGPDGATGEVTVHFGEAFKDGRINRQPPGTVRYNLTKVTLKPGKEVLAAPPADKRNTEVDSDRHPPAILTPEEWGVILPFRWVEIEGWPGELTADQLTRQSAFPTDWDEDSAHFECSDELLNRIWDLCRYSIKATSFAGVYVDGDRERIPYEADAYLNQLSHYYTDTDSQMARDTYDHLMVHGTWPTEWAPHMIFMAHADWMRNGDAEWLKPRYEALKAKTLLDRAGPDGLITSTPQQIKKGDIVDWPKGERDGYKFTSVNTVVNAFHLAALHRMADLARAVGKEDEATEFSMRAAKTGRKFQELLFDKKTGLYVDGIGTKHSSHHANFFPLALGLVPSEHKPGVIAFLRKGGMRCSVYAAQYFLEALFENGADRHALGLITADTDRSWKHMVNSGTTITWEAWDQKYKPNQDWNHAWGAAPANLLPRYVLGVQAAKPGWARASILPRIGTLTSAKGKVPTPRGPITIAWTSGETFELDLTLPEGMPATLNLPGPKNATGVFVNGSKVEATRKGKRWVLAGELTGTLKVEVR